MRKPSPRGHAKCPPDGMVTVRGIYPEPCICLDGCTFGREGHVEGCACSACYWMYTPLWCLLLLPSIHDTDRKFKIKREKDDWKKGWTPGE